MVNIRNEFYNALLNSDKTTSWQIFKSFIQTYRPMDFAENIMQEALDMLGQSWEIGSASLSQVYMGGKICEEIIRSFIDETSSSKETDIAIAVLEDHHYLGKRLVYSYLTINGIAVKDYGGTQLNDLVALVKRDNIKILLVSVLMLSSAFKIKQLRAELDNDVKIIVGGAPFRLDKNLWKQVNADAVGHSAQDAVTLIQQIKDGVK